MAPRLIGVSATHLPPELFALLRRRLLGHLCFCLDVHFPVGNSFPFITVIVLRSCTVSHVGCRGMEMRRGGGRATALSVAVRCVVGDPFLVPRSTASGTLYMKSSML